MCIFDQAVLFPQTPDTEQLSPQGPALYLSPRPGERLRREEVTVTRLRIMNIGLFCSKTFDDGVTSQCSDTHGDVGSSEVVVVGSSEVVVVVGSVGV